MKSFFKYLFASILGTLIAFLLGFILFLVLVVSIIPKNNKSFSIKSNSILYLKLDKPIVDRQPSSPLDNFSFMNFNPKGYIGLNVILKNIEKAKTDEKIKGIYLHLSSIDAGFATIDEIRNALIDFKTSGKFIYCYSNQYSQLSYYLSTASDRIYLNPVGQTIIQGMRASLMFFKGTLNKLDIEPQIIRHGKYKSAVESFTNDKMSQENRQQYNVLLNDMWSYMLEKISDSRKIPLKKINTIADSLKQWNANQAIENNFVDSLVYENEMLDILTEQSGLSEKKEEPRLVELTEYNKVSKNKESKNAIKQKIAVIYAQGDIVEEGDGNIIDASKLSKTIRKARKDTTIKAIVLRINSPGGSALASELIRHELELAQLDKPLIISMGDLAASGGYYVSTPADTILANPLTLTGSIGVFGIFFNLKDFFNKKLGVSFDIEKTNKYADFGEPFRSLTEYEKDIIQKAIDDVYSQFMNHVSEGRNLTEDEVEQIAQGRVWSGTMAKQNKLVDLYGGLYDAIKIAAKKAGIEKYTIEELPAPENSFLQLFKEASEEMKENSMKKELGKSYQYYIILKRLQNLNGIQARMPYCIEFY